MASYILAVSAHILPRVLMFAPFSFFHRFQLEALLKGMARRAALARRRAMKQQARLRQQQQQQGAGPRNHHHLEWGSRIDEFLHTDVLSDSAQPPRSVVVEAARDRRRGEGGGRGGVGVGGSNSSRTFREASGRNGSATVPLLGSSSSSSSRATEREYDDDRGGAFIHQQRNVVRIAVTTEELLGAGGGDEVVGGRGAGNWRGFAAQQQHQDTSLGKGNEGAGDGDIRSGASAS